MIILRIPTMNIKLNYAVSEAQIVTRWVLFVKDYEIYY